MPEPVRGGHGDQLPEGAGLHQREVRPSQVQDGKVILTDIWETNIFPIIVLFISRKRLLGPGLPVLRRAMPGPRHLCRRRPRHPGDLPAGSGAGLRVGKLPPGGGRGVPGPARVRGKGEGDLRIPRFPQFLYRSFFLSRFASATSAASASPGRCATTGSASTPAWRGPRSTAPEGRTAAGGSARGKSAPRGAPTSAGR